ncbi:CYTH domain protein [uncultured archaeon]|nr:CYTH domain protein [uncultured archaeon]
MQIEFEVKILDIDVAGIQKKLAELNAKKQFDRLMRRYIFQFNPPVKGRWIRLRDDGSRITLAVKEIEDESKIEGTKEVEVAVGDFEKTRELLQELGFRPKAYQENRRIHYELGGCCIELDFWPKIPAYLEVEGASKEAVEDAVKKLGFDLSQTTTISNMSVYNKYGLDIFDFKELKF